MTLLNRFQPIKLIKASLLTMAALGLALPTASYAQRNLSDETSSTPSRPVLEDGTYLFGQSPSQDVIGSTYIVMSVQDNQTIGAFYMPRSSYDCFSGNVSPTRLAVDIVDSYTQAVYPHTVAVTLTDTLVAGEAAGAYALEGFHRIDQLSEKDAEMLAVCSTDFAQ